MLYRDRLEHHHRETRRLSRHHVVFGYARLVWAAAVAGTTWFVLFRQLTWWWVLLPCLGFALTARYHEKALARGARGRRAISWYEHGLARIEDRWAGRHPRTLRVDASASLYAVDLDIFGPASLFELLCTARSTLGEDTLASWLLHPAAADEVLARQIAIADLRDRTELREAFATAPGPEIVELEGSALAEWGESALPAVQGAAILRWLAPVLAVLTIAAALRWLFTHSPLLLIPLLVVEGSVTYYLQRRLRPLFAEAQLASGRLSVLAELSTLIEEASFTAPLLTALQAQLRDSQRPASKAMLRLARLSAAVEQRGNYILRLLDVPLLYSVQLGLLLQTWTWSYGRHLRSWLDAVGTFETLLSLSAYSFEHPSDPFPEIAPAEAVFVAEGLGHPLLPAERCVRNDVALDPGTRLLLVSGSNMSGKSTLLRSVGISAVLAMAGAPVRARRLRLTPMRLGASIQVNDSLQAGRSRFYAEILRLRSIVDLARLHPPILFLFDELLAGTNSSDRLAGATGLVNELLSADALGLLSTHDLALTRVGGESHATHIRNAHFEDRIEDGKLTFDYTLRPGAVTHSNGVALMRLIGLNV